jgi:glutamyl-Q tRNA(Asp) synthetase
MTASAPAYVGRFAPSPTGPLHAGSLVAALASWLDARAHSGHWLLRIEDIDPPRCVAGMARHIEQQLAACGLVSDAPVLVQSQRSSAYAAALQQLLASGLAYPCGCTRKDIDEALAERSVAHQRFNERVYPGTCRDGLRGKPARATRLRCVSGLAHWHDRRLGAMAQRVEQEVGDFVLKRADGLWAYQIAVVVDDAHQGITDIVRGEDLADNTARQLWLQQCLGLARPRYLHTPLVLGADGHKLSKQNGAMPLELTQPLATLQAAARILQLPELPARTQGQWLAQAVQAWRERWVA